MADAFHTASSSKQPPSDPTIIAGPGVSTDAAVPKYQLPVRVQRNVNPVNTAREANRNELYGIVSLEALLAEGDAFFEQQDAREGPIVKTAEEERIPELSTDGFNEDIYGSKEQRSINTNTNRPLTTAVTVPNNVTYVPISEPRPADSVDHLVNVVRDVQYSHAGLRDLTGLTRSANTDVRRDGSLAASVLAVLGPQEADDPAVPLMGLATRIVQARLTIETGASAAAAPNLPGWDVVITSLSNYSAPADALPGHVPVYIPKDMAHDSAAALLSLLLPGGIGAYGCRFRSNDPANPDPRAAYMPSYSRWLHPGGSAQVLAVFERAPPVLELGGRALTATALRGLEAYYRRVWGNLYMDHAYRAVTALGHVYVNPERIERDLGTSFEAVGATTTFNGDNLRGGDFDWTVETLPPDPNIVAVRFTNERDKPPQLDMETVRAMMDLRNNAGIGQGAINVPANARIAFTWYDVTVTATWTANGQPQSASVTVLELLTWLNAHNGVLAVVRYLVSVFNHEQRILLADRYGVGERDESDVVLAGFRNVYGYNDTSTIAIPEFDLRRCACLIAKVHRPVTSGNTLSNLASSTKSQLRTRVLQFALKAHIASLFVCAGKNFWPDSYTSGPALQHRSIVASMPRGLSNLAFVTNGGREMLDAPNWQILEPVHYLKGAGNSAAYYNYNVPGTWATDENGGVFANSPDTSYPALEAAVRLTWTHRGTIDVGSNIADDFKPVLDSNGLIAPLGFSPIATTNRRLAGVTLFAMEGADLIGAGINRTVDSVSTY